MTEKILKAEYGSDKTPLTIGTIQIPCYVLEGGIYKYLVNITTFVYDIA